MPSQSRIDDIVATAPLLRSETLHLPHSFKIHASALNPTKDLIVLFRLLPSAELSQRRSAKLSLQPFATRIPQRGSASSNVPTHFKGHGIEREEDEDENSGAISLGLWRSLVEASGTDAETDPSVTPPIWEADIPGRRLAGMTWNHDGSILSLLIQVFEKVPQTGAPLFKLVHLSLDGGAITGKVYLRSSLPYDGHHMFEMFWTAHEPCDERIKRESPWELLDLMPQPNVVEEYVRNNQGPFAAMKPVAAIDNSVKKRAYHSVLTSFPASSVANLSSSRLLCVPELTTQSGVGISFHGSTFPLPYALARSNTQLGKTRDTAIQHKSALRIDRPTLEELEIGRASFAVKELLNVILQGVEHCQGIWKDGIDRERIKWIDELEDAAKSHGATLAATHADLTRLLLAGRCGEAVAQFLGGRITDKTLSAWEQAHYAAAEKIHSLTHHSVKPACEHLLVLGEWLLGLAASSSSKQIHLETSTLQKCLSLTKRMAILAIEMNTQIEAETARFRESAKWLRHEIARAAAGSSDEESLPPANHDILSVSDFLTIFLDPPSIGYFLTVDQQIDHSWPESIDSRDAAVLDLKVAMEQTRAKLSAQLGSGPEASRSSSEYAAARSQNSESGVLWGIADILTHEWEQLFKLAIRAGEMSMADPTSATRALARKQGGKLLIGNTVGTATTAAMYLRQRGQVHIWIETQVGSGELNTRHHAFSCHESRLSIVDLNFYDNQNLLIVAEKSSAHPVRYLCQIQLSDLEGDDQRPVPTSFHEHIAHTIAGETVGKEDLADITTVISRAQKVAHGGPLPDLNTCLASNGRPRRRLVCVSVAGGKEIEVFEIE